MKHLLVTTALLAATPALAGNPLAGTDDPHVIGDEQLMCRGQIVSQRLHDVMTNSGWCDYAGLVSDDPSPRDIDPRDEPDQPDDDDDEPEDDEPEDDDRDDDEKDECDPNC